MKDWYSSIYKGFIITGVISFIIGFFSQGEVSIGAYIAGYSVLVLGIMMLLLILFNNILKISQGLSTLQLIYSIVSSTGPFLLMLAVIAFILYLIIKYKTLITSQHISPYYYSFSNIAILLLLIQLYIVYTNISSPQFESTGKITKVTNSLLYLLGVLEAICSIILFTILKYFNTDGFTPLKI
jgi:hypothetical protein